MACSLRTTFTMITLLATGILQIFYASMYSYIFLPQKRLAQPGSTRIVPVTSNNAPTIAAAIPATAVDTPAIAVTNCYELEAHLLEIISTHSKTVYTTGELFQNVESANVSDCFSELSLKSFHLELYERTRKLLNGHSCLVNGTVSSGDILVHSPHNNHSIMTTNTNNAQNGGAEMDGISNKDLVLITTMYHNRQKQYTFINTLLNWSNLTRVQPVLFFTDMNIVEKSGILLYVAYLRGWTIALVPDCLRSGYPLLHTMFKVARTFMPTANWYGYANADIVFTPRFIETVQEINRYNSQPKGPQENPLVFISSRRYEAFIPLGKLYNDAAQISALARNLKPRNGIAIDLFIYHRNCTDVLDKMPAFAVARRGFDNWLVYDVLARHLGSVDITGTSPMVHQGVGGLSLHLNSHRTRSADSEYNMRLWQVTRTKNWIRSVENIPVVSVLERGDSTWMGDGQVLYRNRWQEGYFVIKQRKKMK